METTLAEEMMDVLKKLSPQNQLYMLTLLKVAEAAENGVRSDINEQLCRAAKQTTGIE